MAIVHIYDVGTSNNFWVNNSEIYVCEGSPCSTITLTNIPAIPQLFFWVSSSLLWGAPVSSNYPYMQCMWVTDEAYIGYGWPAMSVSESGGGTGSVTPSYVCP